jgi:ATP-dependent DNA helicase RecQ
LYKFFQCVLGNEIVDPIGSHTSMLENRLFDTFCKGTENEVKDNIIRQFTKLDSKLRLLICTAAFGMGIDCTGVERVIHYGPPSDVESYIQLTGRCGRQGKQSQCIMLYGKGLRKFADKLMLAYCENEGKCTRDILFTDFSSYQKGNNCGCCDECAIRCKCLTCVTTIMSSKL